MTSRLRSGWTTALLFVLLAPPSGALANAVIDFEDWTGSSHLRYSATSHGFLFTSTGLFAIGRDPPDASQNGTLILRTAEHDPLTMARGDGGVFSVIAVDLGEGNHQAPSSQVSITGVRAAGGTVSTMIPLDGIMPDFQTASLSGFDNLLSLSFQPNSPCGFCLDNIVTPEPGAGLLVLVGGLWAVTSGGRVSRRRRGRPS